MAERRMYNKKITDSDDFTKMPSAAQALYFHLNQGADDDGFNNQIQIAMFKAHANINALKILLEKNFVIRFESGVIVIKHWRMHNTLRKDRYTPTNFQEELQQLGLKENGTYTFGCQTVADLVTQNSIGKDSIGKNNILSTSDNADKSYKAVNFQNIVNSYNLICVSLPKVQRLTEARKKAIKSAVEFIGSEKDFENFFKKVEASDFLCGRTENAWIGCGFDWILKKSNLIKILEGNYNNQTKGKSNKPDYYDTSRYENLDFN